jgi:osmotically-inducible protein OsmY
MDRINKTRMLLVFCVLSLQGCMNAAVTSAQAVYDRHNIQSSLNDHYLTMRAEREIYLDTNKFKNTNISVSAFNSTILLTGQVHKTAQKTEAEQIVRNVTGINEIHNLLTVSSTPSPLTRISDTWITAKIKSTLIATNEIDPSQIKVITENGTVYLMGIIPHEQADIAVEIARTTDGVQNVIKVFKFVRITRT